MTDFGFGWSQLMISVPDKHLTWNGAFTVIKYCIEQGQRGPCCFCPSVHNSCSVLSWMVKPRCYLPLFFFPPGGGGGCIEMSSVRGNHLGLSKVQRMLPLQRLKGSRRVWVWEAVQLGRSLVPWVLARCCVIADEFRAVTDENERAFSCIACF